MNPENIENLWRKSLNKSIINNRQLEFHGYFNFAFLNKTNPEIELVKFTEFIDFPNNSFLTSTIDQRSKNFQILKENLNNLLEICWFFALSREKFKIKVRISLLNKDFYLNNSKNPIDSSKQKEILKMIWEKINKEEKNEFHNKLPDSKTIEKEQLTDMDRFNSPDKIEISENFTIILYEPLEVEHSIFPMPQVVADARHTKFESLFQPYKVQRKYVHSFNEEKQVWSICAINP